MAFEVYKIVHLSAIIVLLLSWGALLRPSLSSPDLKAENPRLYSNLMKLHGSGLLLTLIAGFGMVAKLGLNSGLPGWVLGKLAITISLGVLPILVRRRPSLRSLWTAAVVFLAIISGVLAIYKPTFY